MRSAFGIGFSRFDDIAPEFQQFDFIRAQEGYGMNEQ
jgi:hypothetical protein